MSPERWSRIKDIFDRALDEPVEQRTALVHSACVDAPDLETEVLKLLVAHSVADNFLEESAADLHTYLQSQPSRPALSNGMILARRFEIRSFLNAGGMGEVYEAWDADLNVAVALKTILPHISMYPEMIERFKREVRHAREVSHPNICRVHELFCDDSTSSRIWFLTMELLRGTPLRACIQRSGGLPAEQASQIAAQLLSGLEAAHSRNLVHRDFKSSNVMLVEQEGARARAVITDFGLAVGSISGSYLPDEKPGAGTPGYMAPEQVQGGAAGPLADQYSFGVVLFEMMTGSLPPTDSVEQLTSSKAGRSGYPPEWHTVIRRCLQLEPADRFPDMSAVREALIPSSGVRQGLWILVGFTLLTAALLAGVWRRGGAPVASCTICDISQLTPDTDKAESASLSADGRLIAYSSDRAEPGNLDIFVQALPSGALSRITHDSARETTPSISPDGRWVAFRSERAGGGIYLVATASSSEPKLLVAGGRNPRIAPDGKSLLYWTGDPDSSVESGKLFRVGLAGGGPQQIAASFADARYPVWSSDGAHVLFTGCLAAGQLLPDCFDWWVANAYTGAVVQTHAFATLRTHSFLPGRLNSLAWRNDQVIFDAIGPTKRLNLAVISLDARSFGVAGLPQWLLQGQGGDADPTIAEQNRIAFTRTSGALHIWRLRGLTAGRKTVPEKVTADPEVDGSPFVSEGGHFLVFARGRTLKRTIMLRDPATGQETTLVDHGTPVQSPIIDRAGRWIAFQQSEGDGSSAIYAGERGGSMKRVCQNCTEPSGWFGGDKAFFFRDGTHAVGLADPRTGRQQVILKYPGASIDDVCWSAASNVMAYVLSKNTRKQMYAIHLDPGTAQPDSAEVTIGAEGGSAIHPRWFGEGKGILYISNKDGFLCIYARDFDGISRKFGRPIAVAHFHNQRTSIDEVLPRVFNLSADGDTAYFNLGEQNSTIELGQLELHR